MATAKDYGVSFGYGAQDGTYYGPNGRVGPFHRGDDYPTPSGVPVVIAGQTIGYTGATGLVSGPHLHIQAWTGSTGNTRDPRPYSFRPGRVAGVGYGNQWGNYVTIEVDGVNVTYAHLSSTNVSTGQLIQGASDMANRNQVNRIYQAVLFRNGDDGGLNNYQNRDANSIIEEMLGSAERKSIENRLVGQAETINQLQANINQLNQTIATMQQLEATEDITEAEKSKQLEVVNLKFEQSVRELNETKQKLADLMAAPAVPDKPKTTPTYATNKKLTTENKRLSWLTVLLLKLIGKKK